MKIPALPKLSKGTWALIVAVLVILAAVPGLGLIHFTTSHSFFCLSCHKNQEPTDMWLPSRVHLASTGCVDCHTSRGGIVLTHVFSASDDLMNQRCVSCHPSIPGMEQKGLDQVKIVKVSHKKHAEKNVLCIDCHRNVAHDKGTPRTNRPTMETCYHCHQAHPRTQACDKCHPINLVYTKK
ncbi:MAG: NapC/NirT family cytochrome c [Syntrophaceae bacterium]|nr:NapC/NirT family cytochrome c [Syntrophaceae bacterium]